MKRIFSHSQLAVYQKCPRLYKHGYVEYMEQRQRPVYFVFGSAFHAFKEIYWESNPIGAHYEKGINAAMKVFDDVDTSIYNSEDMHTLSVERAKVEGICRAYPTFYEEQDAINYTKVKVEEHAEIKLRGKGAYYQGDIDCLAKDAAGVWWVHESKTASNPSNAYFERVALDNQVTGYMWLAKKILGFFPRGVVYDVVKKPALRLKAGESTSAFCRRIGQEYERFGKSKNYFTRHQVIIGKPQLKEWMIDTSHIAQQALHDLEAGGPWPKHTASCVSDFGSACFMMNACLQGKYDPLRYHKKQRRSLLEDSQNKSSAVGSQ